MGVPRLCENLCEKMFPKSTKTKKIRENLLSTNPVIATAYHFEEVVKLRGSD